MFAQIRVRPAAALLAAIVFTLTAIGCTAQVSSSKPWRPLTEAEIANHEPVTLEMWSFHSGPEAEEVQQVLDRLHSEYPWLTVNLVQAKEDFDILQGIYSGRAPDIAVLAGPGNVARFCATGGMPNLAPIAEQDGVDLAKIIPPPVLKTATFEGSTCVLPWLTDAYGLFYNKDLFAAAGIEEPPRTLDELERVAKKLTTYNEDGSIDVAGFVPLPSFYHSSQVAKGRSFGADWYDSNGKSALASDPRWAEGFRWQREYIDSVGYDKLQQFAASVGTDSEYTPNNAFQTGKVAMIIDGEWRTRYLNQQPDLNYGTAPFPTMKEENYGAGKIGGTMITMPSTAKHPAEAWLAIKYLALDTGALNQIADLLQNVPTTYESLETSNYSKQPENKAFIEILQHPDSGFKEHVRAGQVDLDLVGEFAERYQSGSIPDLDAGLRDLARSIDAQVAVE